MLLDNLLQSVSKLLERKLYDVVQPQHDGHENGFVEECITVGTRYSVSIDKHCDFPHNRAAVGFLRCALRIEFRINDT